LSIFARAVQRLPQSAPSLATGVGHVCVGSNDPNAVAAVRCSDVVRSQHTPRRVIPERGKITDDDGKTSSHKER
jgi:hypothetical protein